MARPPAQLLQESIRAYHTLRQMTAMQDAPAETTPTPNEWNTALAAYRDAILAIPDSAAGFLAGQVECACGHPLARHWPGPGRCLVCDCTSPETRMENTMPRKTTEPDREAVAHRLAEQRSRVAVPPLCCEPGSAEYQRLNEFVPDPDAPPSMRRLLADFETVAEQHRHALATRESSTPYTREFREAQGNADAAVSRASQLVRSYVDAAVSDQTGALVHGEPWPTITGLVAWLDKQNGTEPHEKAMRLLKLTEEVGEVGQAYIGYTGQNPRKGVTHSAEDVAAELCDVIVTAMVALHDYVTDPAAVFAAKVEAIAKRAADRVGPAQELTDLAIDVTASGTPLRHEYGGGDRLHGICRCGEGRDADVHR